MKNILVLEDNQEINEILSNTLKDEGYTVFSCFNAFDALEVFADERIGLIISDLMLPIKSGEEFIEDIRKTSTVHIIAITAKVNTTDKLHTLTIGADDYITKPFNKQEVVIKVNNYFKKLQVKDVYISINSGKFKLNTDNNELIINNNTITLTSVEYIMLKKMLESLNKIINRESFLDTLNYNNFEVFDRVVDTHIKNIRGKIKKVSNDNYIKTVYGLGYKLTGDLDE